MNQDFDLIVSTGVLHHLAVPEAGIKALAQHLRNFKNLKFAGSIFPMIFSGDAAPEINAGLSARQHVRTVVIASYNFRHKSRGMGFFAMFW